MLFKINILQSELIEYWKGRIILASWNELFLDERNIAALPQPEVYRFVKKLEGAFTQEKLSIWDLCCGAGRHTVLIAKMGHNAFGSDISENGIEHTKMWLKNNCLEADLKISDMTEFPWKNQKFHGAFSWDALHHNTIANIEKAVQNVYDSLLDGGMFMVSLLSTKSGSYHKGREIEYNTFISDDGDEAGVTHHYFDESEIRDLFSGWKILNLVEQVNTYIETEPLFYLTNPFPYTKWGVIVQK